jgi:hypothetical protein
VIKRIFEVKAALKTHVKIAYMVNYDWQLAQLMTAGVDVWLNTPQPPLEASGTSGMKAALTGVPSLSGHRATPPRSTTSWSEWSCRAAVLPRPRAIHRRHATRHRSQRLILQHAAHGAATAIRHFR